MKKRLLCCTMTKKSMIRLLIISLFFSFCSTCLGQNKNIDSIFVNLSESEFNSELMDNLFNKSNVVYLGDKYGYANTDKIHIQTFKYLYKYHDFKKIALPLPRSSNRLIQKYFNTGNSLYIDSILTYFENEDKLRYALINLYDMCKNDPEVNVIAINKEFGSFALSELRYILNQEKFDSKSKRSLNSEKNLEVISIKNEVKLLNILQRDMYTNRKLFQKEMSEEGYKQYDALLNHTLAEAVLSLDYDSDLKAVDDVLYKNFLDLTFLDKESKIYIACGRDYVCKKENSNWYDLTQWSSFENKLQNKYSELKFVSGIIYYINIDDVQKEIRDNSEIIKDVNTRGDIIDKTKKYSFMNTQKFEDRIDYMIIDNEK